MPVRMLDSPTAATTVATISSSLAAPISDADTHEAMSASEASGTCCVVPIMPGTLLRIAMMTARTVLANSEIRLQRAREDERCLRHCRDDDHDAAKHSRDDARQQLARRIVLFRGLDGFSHRCGLPPGSKAPGPLCGQIGTTFFDRLR